MSFDMLKQGSKSHPTSLKHRLLMPLLLMGSFCAMWHMFSLSNLNPSEFSRSTQSIFSHRAFSRRHFQRRAPRNIPPKPKWVFGKDKVIGVSLGNWLVLERWMSEDWFVSKGGPNVWDEWGFTKTLGPKARSILEEHWSTWFTEADLDKVLRAKVNTIRVPIGFWMMIPTLPSEPYVTKGQLAHFEKLCQWAYARNMYIIIDLHGHPGSQNGEQQSGHNTTTPSFYQPLQQARADQFVKAVVDWVSKSPYYSIVSAIEVVNEPRPYTTEQRAMLRAFYERSYTTIQTLGPKAPVMLFADGFVPGHKLAYWWDFASAHKLKPNSIAMNDHPYPGFFPAQSNRTDIMNQVCRKGAKYANFPVTTLIAEWTLRTAIQEVSFEKAFYQAQLLMGCWYAGAVFWSWKNLPSKHPVLADKVAAYQWSFETLLERGVVALPATPNQSTDQFLRSLHSPCGASPKIQRNGPKPTGPEAEKAYAAAAAAKAMIPGINKAISEAAKSLRPKL